MTREEAPSLYNERHPRNLLEGQLNVYQLSTAQRADPAVESDDESTQPPNITQPHSQEAVTLPRSDPIFVDRVNSMNFSKGH